MAILATRNNLDKQVQPRMCLRLLKAFSLDSIDFLQCDGGEVLF